jgi:hypothetical protein
MLSGTAMKTLLYIVRFIIDWTIDQGFFWQEMNPEGKTANIAKYKV